MTASKAYNCQSKTFDRYSVLNVIDELFLFTQKANRKYPWKFPAQIITGASVALRLQLGI